ncbi:MAG: EamA family transporter [Spirochaetes bacterium]|nr:EamA family transporter [Spirochaetota bacterium]
MAIVYALCSLVFAGINDAVFKSYSAKSRPLGAFFLITGLMSLAVFSARGLARGALFLDAPTLGLGLAAGFFSAAANILLVYAMRHTGAAVASSIYRLNLVLVALLAFVFLGESFPPAKLAALAIAVAAVLVFSGSEGARPGAARFVGVLVAACALRAGMGLLYKVASLHHVCEDSFLALTGFTWAISGLLLHLFGKERGAPGDRGAWRIPLVSGALICGIILTMKLAVNTGEAGVVITITQFSFLVTFPIATVAFREKVTPRKVAGLALAAGCIALLTQIP